MRSASVLRVSIVLQWFSIVVAMVLSFTLASNLPAPLTSWQTEEAARELTAGDALVLAVFVVAFVAVAIGSIGLLFLQESAAGPYLASHVALLGFGRGGHLAALERDGVTIAPAEEHRAAAGERRS